MGVFIRILSRLKVAIVFILLEILAIVIISDRSVFQKSKAAQLTIEFSSFLYSKSNEMYSYFSLKPTNEKLSRHNAILQQEIEHLKTIIAEEKYSAVLRKDTSVNFIPAKIINKSLGGIDNYFVLDKGISNGIREGFGVVSNGCIVGVISDVSEHYSTVLLAISSKLKISAKIKKDNYLCSVDWDENSLSRGTVYGIPRHIAVRIGDTITTSGFSSIFPENYTVGKVLKVTYNRSTASNDLVIDYSADIMRINFADIVIVKNRDELYDIEQKMER